MAGAEYGEAAEHLQQLKGVIMLKVDLARWLASQEIPQAFDVHFEFDQKDHALRKPSIGETNVVYQAVLGDIQVKLHATGPLDYSRLDYFAALMVAFVGVIVTWFAFRLLHAHFSHTSWLEERYDYSRGKLDEQRNELITKDTELQQQKMALDEHSIVSTADLAGRITSVNDKFCEISGYSRKELIGQNHRIIKSDQHPASFYKTLWKTISSGKTWQGVVCNQRKDGRYYWVESTITPILDENDVIDHYVSIRTDITAQMASQKMLSEQRQLLEMVQNSMRYFVQVTDLQQLARTIIDELCVLTGSEYAVIGEALRDAEGRPYLKVHAISDPALDKESYSLQQAGDDVELHDRDNIITRPLVSGDVYISNTVNIEAQPKINNYLGIPVFYGEELVGMYGIANREGGFDERMLSYLRPFTTAYGVMINAAHVREREKSAQSELLEAKNPSMRRLATHLAR